MNEQAMEEIKVLINKNFDVPLDILNESKNISLLSSKIGLLPRDLLKLIVLLEEEYSIKITENEIIGTRVDYLKNLVRIIEQKLK